MTYPRHYPPRLVGVAITRAALAAEARSRAGCVTLRRARSTGTLVGLYRSFKAGLEIDPDYPWSTVCEDHGGIVCHRTRALAAQNLSHPEEWCPDCQERRTTE